MSILSILIIATNTSSYASGKKTGLWLSELTHVYHAAKQKGYRLTIASPKGRVIPIDPESLKSFMLDKISRDYWYDPVFRSLLDESKSLSEVSAGDYDVVYLAGGHGTMYDFPDDTTLQKIITDQYVGISAKMASRSAFKLSPHFALK